MKRKPIYFLLFIFMLTFSFCFVSCKEKEVQPVVIDLTGVEVAEDTTLLAYMQELQESGELSFSVEDGMVVAINGVENAATYNPCWMLYTSDVASSNLQWGSFTYEGQSLGSAIVGAEALIVKTGEVYVWSYQTF